VDDPRGDAELIADARSGDHASWTILMRRHAPRLAAYLGARLRRPDVVEGLVGESVVAAWLHLPELDDPAGFSAFFRRTGAGLAMRWAREHPDESLDSSLSTARLGTADPHGIERLDRLIGSLEETRRMAVELRWRGGLTGSELAAALRTTPEAAEKLANEAESTLLAKWDAE